MDDAKKEEYVSGKRTTITREEFIELNDHPSNFINYEKEESESCEKNKHQVELQNINKHRKIDSTKINLEAFKQKILALCAQADCLMCLQGNSKTWSK